MKRIVLLFPLLGLLFLFSCEKEQEPLTSNSDQVISQRAPVLIKFGTRSKPCDCIGNDGVNDGCDGDRGICLIIRFSIYNGEPLDNFTGVGEFSFSGRGNPVKISLVQANDDFDPTLDTLFFIDSDILVSEEIVDGGITLKQGVYPIDYSQNPLGEVLVDTE